MITKNKDKSIFTSVNTTGAQVSSVKNIMDKLENIAKKFGYTDDHIPVIFDFLGGQIDTDTGSFDIAGFKQYLADRKALGFDKDKK